MVYKPVCKNKKPLMSKDIKGVVIRGTTFFMSVIHIEIRLRVSCARARLRSNHLPYRELRILSGAVIHVVDYEHLMSVNGDEAESFTLGLCNYALSRFNHSVQKLPSITGSSKHLSANGRSSLGSLVMYSSFSLPLSIYYCIK